jgi:hypothetical protein
MVGDLKIVRPEPLLNKDIKVQVNKQKPKIECPAQMKHNSDKMPIAPMSSQPCSKPNVACRTFCILFKPLSAKGFTIIQFGRPSLLLLHLS